MEYDFLGRMKKRIAPEGVASWFFDNPGEGGKLGVPPGARNTAIRKTF